MEDYKFYIKKFKIALGILGATLLLFIMLVSQIAPNIERIANIQQNTKRQTEAIADAERKIEDLKKEVQKKTEPEANPLKEFFKPINGGIDTETAIADEFGEILEVMRENKIKARSIETVPDPQDDNFVRFAGNKYHVYAITAEMIGSYNAFGNFLRDLYKHEHFLEISKIEIVPYQKNKKILLATLQLKLYAQREFGSIPAPTSTTNSDENVVIQNQLPSEQSTSPTSNGTEGN